MKKFLSIVVCGALLVACGTSKTSSGSITGGNGQGVAVGAAIGTTVGSGPAALIGNKMEKKAAELAKLENAQVETVTDVNGLKAIRVTFSSSTLFDFNKSTLKPSAMTQLDKFAEEMTDMPETHFTICGHTDNVGTEQANKKVSAQRADSVEKYLRTKGIAKKRMTAEGLSFNFPVADNDTEAGRTQNRRVEIYISANEEMVKKAEERTLQ